MKKKFRGIKVKSFDEIVEWIAWGFGKYIAWALDSATMIKEKFHYEFEFVDKEKCCSDIELGIWNKSKPHYEKKVINSSFVQLDKFNYVIIVTISHFIKFDKKDKWTRTTKERRWMINPPRVTGDSYSLSMNDLKRRKELDIEKANARVN